MRLWSLHPKYLDDQTLYQTWKYGMIAMRAMTGKLAAYEQRFATHGQLERFKEQPDPVQALCDYMHALIDESERRGWKYPRFFQRSSLPKSPNGTTMTVTAGQMECEVWLYSDILSKRRGSIQDFVYFFGIEQHHPHPIFELVRGPVGSWERGTG